MCEAIRANAKQQHKGNMTNTCNDLEMVYGIYFGETHGGFSYPIGERQAQCIISEGDNDQKIIKNLVASDFLNHFMKYTVIDNGPSIHIHYDLEGELGRVAIVLMYEEDL